MKNPKKILVIIQRSNGDVLMASTLIKYLYEYYNAPKIDLLVNNDTIAVAKLLPYINSIIEFSYQKKRDQRWMQEKKIILSIFRKYDLSINLTASDRSVLYALIASKKSISAVEKTKNKSWWKTFLLSHHYYFDSAKHILFNNLKPLKLLKIQYDLIHISPTINEKISLKVTKKLINNGIKDFIIFHPSAQYSYKIYPTHLRDKLLHYLSKLGIPIIITGSSNKIDTEIKKSLKSMPNIIDWIGETTIDEYLALSDLSIAYIGMDTLNMHIAASQNKTIFAIFGPTLLSTWSPWSNELKMAAKIDMPIQSYGGITLFQADMKCVACGMAGCDNKHGKSECLDNISPESIFNNVQNWFVNKSH